jgi:hypothetical protein
MKNALIHRMVTLKCFFEANQKQSRPKRRKERKKKNYQERST